MYSTLFFTKDEKKTFLLSAQSLWSQKKLCSYSKAKKEKHFCLVRKSINTEVSNHCTLSLHNIPRMRFAHTYVELICILCIRIACEVSIPEQNAKTPITTFFICRYILRYYTYTHVIDGSFLSLASL